MLTVSYGKLSSRVKFSVCWVKKTMIFKYTCEIVILDPNLITYTREEFPNQENILILIYIFNKLVKSVTRP